MSHHESKALNASILRDDHYPVHRIADRLEPYLRVLVEQFHPTELILFGSYAYGQPTEDSDVDLLVVKELHQSPLKETTAILRAWRPVHEPGQALAIELIVESGDTHAVRKKSNSAFYEDIVSRGLNLLRDQ